MTTVSATSILQAGLVWAGTMAWADAITTGVKQYYPHDEKKLLQAKIIYAIILTVIILSLFHLMTQTTNKLNEIQAEKDRANMYK